jgi:hypothetical protein
MTHITYKEFILLIYAALLLNIAHFQFVFSLFLPLLVSIHPLSILFSSVSTFQNSMKVTFISVDCRILAPFHSSCNSNVPTQANTRKPSEENVCVNRKKLILLHVHPLLDSVFVNKFQRRQILDRQSVTRLRNNRGSCVFRVRSDVTTVESDHVTCVFCRSYRCANRLAGYQSRDICLLQVHIRSSAIK